MTNPFVDKDSELEYGLKAKDIPAIIIPSKPLITLVDRIDLQPALNGKKYSQLDWITKYNSQEGEFKGKRMITAPDVYKAGKDGSKELLQSLREDFGDKWIATGTRLMYNPNDLSVKVVHNFKSTVAKPQEIAVVDVPQYKGTKATEVLERTGLSYAQAIFGTSDESSKMLSILETLSQKPASDIRFWTPDQYSRKNRPERSVDFSCDDGGFHVGGGGGVDGAGYAGRSRGVRFK